MEIYPSSYRRLCTVYDYNNAISSNYLNKLEIYFIPKYKDFIFKFFLTPSSFIRRFHETFLYKDFKFYKNFYLDIDQIRKLSKLLYIKVNDEKESCSDSEYCEYEPCEYINEINLLERITENENSIIANINNTGLFVVYEKNSFLIKILINPIIKQNKKISYIFKKKMFNKILYLNKEDVCFFVYILNKYLDLMTSK